MTIGTFVESAALLISVGLNGLAIWFVKDYQRMAEENEELHHASITQEETIEELSADVKNLRSKLTPWNKGKAGTYKKLARKAASTILNNADAFDAALAPSGEMLDRDKLAEVAGL